MIKLTDEIKEIIKSKNLNWEYISKEIILPEDFIIDHQSDVWWSSISECQTLSEDFIRKFKNSVSWAHISLFQNLSENFIKEFKRKINFEYLYKNEKISLSLKLKIMLYFNNLSAPEKIQVYYHQFLNSIANSISNEKIEAFIVMEKLTE